MRDPLFAPYIERWGLVPDGAPIVTPAARLLPVQRNDTPAILKVVTLEEAKPGNVLLAWWGGVGAAHVYEMNGDTVLMERALGTRSLVEFATGGRDDEATAILCDAVAALHTPRGKPFPNLVPLENWFEPLGQVARTQGGLMARIDNIFASALLDTPRDILPLHGDIHHANVLDFGARGWLAIDPHAVLGERGFDYANIFTNPDIGDETISVARDRDRFRRRVEIVTARSGIERERLLQWIVAWCGLSAAWFIEDGMSAEIDFVVAEMALAELQA
jgi:streptomycin 6-kinase